MFLRDELDVGDCYSPWCAFAELDVYVLLTGVNALLFDVLVVGLVAAKGGCRVVLCRPVLVALSMFFVEVSLGLRSPAVSPVLVAALGVRRGCPWTCGSSSRLLGLCGRCDIDEGFSRYSCWALAELDVDEFAMVPPLLFDLYWCSSLPWTGVVFGRVGPFQLVSWSWVSSPPREGAEWLPVVLPFLVSSLVFSDEAFVLLFFFGSVVVVGLAVRAHFSGFSPQSTWLGRFFFCGISGVAGCPPGGEICGM